MLHRPLRFREKRLQNVFIFFYKVPKDDDDDDVEESKKVEDMKLPEKTSWIDLKNGKTVHGVEVTRMKNEISDKYVEFEGSEICFQIWTTEGNHRMRWGKTKSIFDGNRYASSSKSHDVSKGTDSSCINRKKRAVSTTTRNRKRERRSDSPVDNHINPPNSNRYASSSKSHDVSKGTDSSCINRKKRAVSTTTRNRKRERRSDSPVDNHINPPNS
ncbi:hypothetical protein Tco_0827764, partial [Tanacetum coccineum]